MRSLQLHFDKTTTASSLRSGCWCADSRFADRRWFGGDYLRYNPLDCLTPDQLNTLKRYRRAERDADLVQIVVRRRGVPFWYPFRCLQTMINKKKEELSFLVGMQPLALLCEEESTTNYVFGYARMWQTNNAWKQTGSATIKWCHRASKDNGSGKLDKAGDLVMTEESCSLSELNGIHSLPLSAKLPSTPKWTETGRMIIRETPLTWLLGLFLLLWLCIRFYRLRERAVITDSEHSLVIFHNITPTLVNKFIKRLSALDLVGFCDLR